MFYSSVRERRAENVAAAAHVIVCGNEKGGSGKTTTAIHVAVALLKSGYKVATVDLDGRQQSLTRYIENRRRWGRSTGTLVEIPHHFHVPPASRDLVTEAEGEEYRKLVQGLADIESTHDFIVVDTPGADTFLNRLAHRIADTLITPMNDSFVDFDVLASVDPVTYEISGESRYARAVRDARRERRQSDSTVIDWVVLRTRMSSISSRNEQRIETCLQDLATELGFRGADGIGERTVYRELFPFGLTVLDEPEDKASGGTASPSQLAARQEIRALMSTLKLPTDVAGRNRAEARRSYAEAAGRPLIMPDIFSGPAD